MFQFNTFLHLIVIIVFVMAELHLKAQAPEWMWVTNATGPDNFGRAESVTTDAAGNVYAAGYFDCSAITFGAYTLTGPNNGNEQLSLVKYDPSGNVLWAKGATGIYGNSANSVAVDKSGNVYITGSFENSDIKFGTTTLINSGSADIFLVKYDADGNVVWAKSAGSTYSDISVAVKTGPNGEVYISGLFSSNTLSFGSTILTKIGVNSYIYDTFLAKYDTDGNVLWAKSAGGEFYDTAHSLAVDDEGNAYVAGEFESPTMTFGANTITNTETGGGHSDIYLAKYDTDGNVIWAKSAGGSDVDVANSIALDKLGNLFLTGDFRSPALAFGSTTLTSSAPGYHNIFIAKYNANGDEIWARGTGGDFNNTSQSVATDNAGNAYITGYISSSGMPFGDFTLFNPVTSAGIIFIVKYDTYGNVIWVKSTIESGSYGKAIAVDNSGNIFITGTTGRITLHFDGISIISPDYYGNYTAKLSNYSVNTLVTDVSCYAGNNGSATALVTGGTPPFTYLWETSPVQTTSTITNLEAGNYKVTVTDALGKSMIAYALVNMPAINQKNINEVICKGDLYQLNGKLYQATGIFYDTLVSANGCDSILKLSLDVHVTDTLHLIQSICRGNNFNFYGSALTTDGKYFHSLVSSLGCDSIIELNLAVNPDFVVNNPQTICNGGSYTNNNHVYTIAGDYADALKSITGCDSIVTTRLTVNPDFRNENRQTICSGSSYSFNGKTYSSAGIYTDSLQSLNGCDSLLTLILSVNPPDTLKTSLSVCEGDTYNFNGTFLTNAGVYYHTQLTAAGCNQVTKLKLYVNPLPTHKEAKTMNVAPGASAYLTASGGISYEWNPPDFLDDPKIPNPVSTPLNDILYVVTVTDINSCKAYDTVNVSIAADYIWFPNAFTPNSDGINEVFRPKANHIGRFSMMIYNRWGQFLYETNNSEKGWNGYYQGVLCPEGLYVFTSTYEMLDSGEIKTVKGSFTLLR